MLDDDTAIMLFAYAKNEREDLTQQQKEAALRLIKEMRDG